MLNQIKIFENDNFKVKTKISEDGEVLFDAATVAKCLNLTRIAASGNVSVRWERINKYLENIRTHKKGMIKKGDFITESELYMLCLKAQNKMAIKLQLWLATEVLPSIRQYGAYIAPDAKKEDVDKLEKFSKYRIRKTFSNASKGDIQKLIDEFDDFINTMSAKDTIVALNSAIKGLETFKENNKDSAAYQFLIEEKLRSYTKLLLTKHNKINGGIKAYKTKQINNLNNDLKEWQDYANALYPSPEEFITIPIHPFSFNYMFKTLEDNVKVKTDDYKTWIKMFPKVDWPELNPDAFYDVFLEFGAIEAFDTDNLIKATLDQIVRDTNLEDDNNFMGVTTYKTIVDNYKDGFIRVCIKELN